MEEVEISDAIYGDLGDFELNEKLKEKSQEISNLTDRLRQSVATITDLQNEILKLKKEYRDVEKSYSSLLQTARVEIKRKDTNITSLRQQVDNQIFRRSNKSSIGIQTENMQTDAPVSSTNHHNGNITEQKPTETWNITSSNINKFRIPKKNPFARNENINELRNPIAEKIEDTRDHSRHRLPKKNPNARCLHTDKEKPNFIYENRFVCKEPEEEKTKPKHPSDEMKDNRGSKVVMHSQRDNKNDSSDDHKRHSHYRRNGRRHSRDRSFSEADRYSKRHRSNSSSNSHRARSTTSRNEDRRARKTSPKERNYKSKNSDRVDSLKEKELEALLLAQRKVLDEISCNDRNKRMESKKCDDLENIDNGGGSAITRDADVADTKNGVDGISETTEVLSVVSSYLKPSYPKISTNTNNSNPLVPLKKSLSPIKEPSQLPDSTVSSNEPKINQIHSNENSNGAMDIDFELSERVSNENQKNLSCEVNETKLLVENSSSLLNPIVNEKNTCEPIATQINASIIALENHIPIHDSVSANNLDSSFQRHTLSKSSEYTVQDVGHEIRIFLTKKRKKNRNAKAAL